MSQKYHWLKLQKDFFKRHDIRIVESMPNGKDYILFYMKLLLESITHNGELRFSESVPYNEQMLSIVTDTNVDIVRAALQVFRQLGMVEILDDETIYMSEVNKMIGSETDDAVRKREYRAKKAAQKLPKWDNVPQLSQKCPTELDIDIELDKDKELDISCIREKKTTTKRFTPPTLEELNAYKAEIGSSVDAEHFLDYYQANGWMAGKNKMKDWKATFRNWERRENKSSKAQVDAEQRKWDEIWEYAK